MNCAGPSVDGAGPFWDVRLCILAVLVFVGEKNPHKYKYKDDPIYTCTCIYLTPEVFIESTGYHTAFEEDCYSLRVALRDLKVEVVPPVLQLGPLQRLHVEVGPLYLGREREGVGWLAEREGWQGERELAGREGVKTERERGNEKACREGGSEEREREGMGRLAGREEVKREREWEGLQGERE